MKWEVSSSQYLVSCIFTATYRSRRGGCPAGVADRHIPAGRPLASRGAGSWIAGNGDVAAEPCRCQQVFCLTWRAGWRTILGCVLRAVARISQVSDPRDLFLRRILQATGACRSPQRGLPS